MTYLARMFNLTEMPFMALIFLVKVSNSTLVPCVTTVIMPRQLLIHFGWILTPMRDITKRLLSDNIFCTLSPKTSRFLIKILIVPRFIFFIKVCHFLPEYSGGIQKWIPDQVGDDKVKNYFLFLYFV